MYALSKIISYLLLCSLWFLFNALVIFFMVEAYPRKQSCKTHKPFYEKVRIFSPAVPDFS